MGFARFVAFPYVVIGWLSLAAVSVAAQAQLAGIAKVAGLISSAGGCQYIALVTVEQRDGHRQPHDIHPLAFPFIVLATHTYGEVRNALSFLQAKRGFTLLDLQLCQP